MALNIPIQERNLAASSVVKDHHFFQLDLLPIKVTGQVIRKTVKVAST